MNKSIHFSIQQIFEDSQESEKEKASAEGRMDVGFWEGRGEKEAGLFFAETKETYTAEAGSIGLTLHNNEWT